jgi:hypothetical protein
VIRKKNKVVQNIIENNKNSISFSHMKLRLTLIFDPKMMGVVVIFFPFLPLRPPKTFEALKKGLDS